MVDRFLNSRGPSKPINKIKKGVFQGTILGPIIFTLYIIEENGKEFKSKTICITFDKTWSGTSVWYFI